MEDDDPIREEKTLFEKFRERFGKRKHEIIITTSNPYRHPEINIDYDTLMKFGITAEEASRRLMYFSKILTPNEMRDLIERRSKK